MKPITPTAIAPGAVSRVSETELEPFLENGTGPAKKQVRSVAREPGGDGTFVAPALPERAGPAWRER